MPIQIQCTSVVIRNTSLDRVLEDGAKGFKEIAPNAMSYSDDCLSQASFMSSMDAEVFAQELELRGLERGLVDPDFVVVNAHNQLIDPPCDWLILFEYEKRLIATMRGSESRTVIASALDADFDPSKIKAYSYEEIEQQFDFVERKDNIDTYRHKVTGELVYHTRITETPDEIFARAFKTVWQHRREIGSPPKTGDNASPLSDTIHALQSLISTYPTMAKPHLAIGMAWYALGKADVARNHLEVAAKIEPDNTIILKELGGVCLDQGDFAGAMDATTRAVAIKPDDPELLGNLAVSQLLAEEKSKAKQTIAYALSKAPGDLINRNICAIIDEVLGGRRDVPKSINELMAPPQKKKVPWYKLFGFGK